MAKGRWESETNLWEGTLAEYTAALSVHDVGMCGMLQDLHEQTGLSTGTVTNND